MSLIRDTPTQNGLKQHAAKIAIETAPFGDTFGPKAQRKRPKLAVSTLEDLAGESVKMHGEYLERLEQAKLLSGTSNDNEDGDDNGDEGLRSAPKETVFGAGQSKRIWNGEASFSVIGWGKTANPSAQNFTRSLILQMCFYTC
jgi:nuclear GTP-binding protein